MDTRFPFSPAEVAKVHMVQFGILSPDEIVISPQALVVEIDCILTNSKPQLKPQLTKHIARWFPPQESNKAAESTSSDLGFRSGLGEEEACGGCGVLGGGVGDRKEERKEEEGTEGGESGCRFRHVFDFCREGKGDDRFGWESAGGVASSPSLDLASSKGHGWLS
ncbi:hypothetical protein Droror1_Dr00011974 [Drosera rotundifolia]